MNSHIDNDGSLPGKFSRKKSNAKRKGIEFLLSYEQYVHLVESAGLVASDIGRKGGYDLARYGDEGPYSIDNCRFITHGDNIRERKVSDKMRAHQTALLKGIYERRAQLSPEERSAKAKAAAANRIRPAESLLREAARIASLHPSYAGPRNSQFGTFWITDGTVNRKWNPSLGALPEGFYKGRCKS